MMRAAEAEDEIDPNVEIFVERIVAISSDQGEYWNRNT
jgi:hypothetical protein